MKRREDWMKQVKKWGTALERYKFILLIMILGTALLLLPATSDAVEANVESIDIQSQFDLTAIEEKLAENLSKVQGAGEVSVVLTLQGGTRQILAMDSSIAQEDGAVQEEKQTVVISRGSGYEEPVALQEIYPIYQGALLVCPGGDDPTVAYKLTQAVSALTGLGADKISICKAE